MGKNIISFGKCNKYYKYIFFAVIFSTITTIVFGTGHSNYSNILYITFLYPEETKKTITSLSNHIIIHNIYRNFIVLIVSIIFYYYEISSSKSNKIKKNNNNKSTGVSSLSAIELLYDDISAKKQKLNLYNIFIIFLYIIQDILTILYFKFDLRKLDFWAFEFPLLSFLNHKLLKVKIYKHHKYSICISFIIGLIIKIMEIFFYLFSNDYKDEIYNKYKFLYLVGIFSYLIIIALRVYSITEIKILMDFKYISHNKLMIIMGIFGIIINFLILLIFTYNKCATIDNIDIHLCNVVNNNSSRDEAYLDNFFIYFKNLGDSQIYEIIIEVFSSFIGSITYFCYIYFYILIVKYLSCVHYIFYDFIYSFVVKIIFIFVSIITQSNFDNEKLFNNIIFITAAISNIISALCIWIYCEIIELNFCNLNFYLRSNIIFRSEIEQINNAVVDEKSDKTESLFDIENFEEEEDNNDIN